MDPIRLKAKPELYAADIECCAEIDDADEPKTEELIEMLREALEDVKAGRTRPVEELPRKLDEIRAGNEAVG